MTPQEYYNLYKSELLKAVYEVGYSTKELAEDAYKDNMSIYEYILLLNDIKEI